MRKATVHAILTVGTVAFLTACGDARLDKLALGISPDSTATVIGEPPHRTQSYFNAGKLWDLQLYARNRAVEGDSIPWRKLSPVVFIDHKAVGWGWSWWGKESAKMGFAMPK